MWFSIWFPPCWAPADIFAPPPPDLFPVWQREKEFAQSDTQYSPEWIQIAFMQIWTDLHCWMAERRERLNSGMTNSVSVQERERRNKRQWQEETRRREVGKGNVSQSGALIVIGVVVVVRGGRGGVVVVMTLCSFFGCCFYSNWEQCCLPVSCSLYQSLFWFFYNNDVSNPFVLFLFFLVFPLLLLLPFFPSPPPFHCPSIPSSLPTGCAFVTFSTRAMAQNAIKAMHQSQTMEVLYSCPFFNTLSLCLLKSF